MTTGSPNHPNAASTSAGSNGRRIRRRVSILVRIRFFSLVRVPCNNTRGVVTVETRVQVPGKSRHRCYAIKVLSRRRTTSTKAFLLAEVGTGDFSKYRGEIVPETFAVYKPERKPQMPVEASWLGRQMQLVRSRRV